jgi:hypothetical protein
LRQNLLDTDPLHAIYGGVAWEPWSADLAAVRFMLELEGLGVKVTAGRR